MKNRKRKKKLTRKAGREVKKRTIGGSGLTGRANQIRKFQHLKIYIKNQFFQAQDNWRQWTEWRAECAMNQVRPQ